MNNRSHVINKISILGMIINLFLIIVKCFAGVISGSNALLADSLHSFEDMTASVLSFIGAKISAKKQNDKYCFGYGKSFGSSIFTITGYNCKPNYSRT